MINESLHNFISNLENIDKYSQEITNKYLNEPQNKGYLKALNEEQLNDGQLSDGDFLPEYSDTSVEEYGKPRGRIKLYDTGDFHQSIFATIKNNIIKFDAKDSKWEQPPVNLKFYYGENVLGLTEQSIKEVEDIKIVPFLIIELQKYLTKKN